MPRRNKKRRNKISQSKSTHQPVHPSEFITFYQYLSGDLRSKKPRLKIQDAVRAERVFTNLFDAIDLYRQWHTQNLATLMQSPVTLQSVKAANGIAGTTHDRRINCYINEINSARNAWIIGGVIDRKKCVFSNSRSSRKARKNSRWLQFQKQINSISSNQPQPVILNLRDLSISNQNQNQNSNNNIAPEKKEIPLEMNVFASLKKLADAEQKDFEVPVAKLEISGNLAADKEKLDAGSVNRCIIFVIDCSGSMSGSRITTIRQALQPFVYDLASNPHIVMELIAFETNATSQRISPDPGKASNQVKKELHARGGTDFARASTKLKQVARNIINQPSTQGFEITVIICSDGEVSKHNARAAHKTWKQFVENEYSPVFDGRVPYVEAIGISDNHDADILDGFIINDDSGNYTRTTDSNSISEAFQRAGLEASTRLSYKLNIESVSGNKIFLDSLYHRSKGITDIVALSGMGDNKLTKTLDERDFYLNLWVNHTLIESQIKTKGSTFDPDSKGSGQEEDEGEVVLSLIVNGLKVNVTLQVLDDEGLAQQFLIDYYHVILTDMLTVLRNIQNETQLKSEAEMITVQLESLKQKFTTITNGPLSMAKLEIELKRLLKNCGDDEIEKRAQTLRQYKRMKRSWAGHNLIVNKFKETLSSLKKLLKEIMTGTKRMQEIRQHILGLHFKKKHEKRVAKLILSDEQLQKRQMMYDKITKPKEEQIKNLDDEYGSGCYLSTMTLKDCAEEAESLYVCGRVNRKGGMGVSNPEMIRIEYVSPSLVCGSYFEMAIDVAKDGFQDGNRDVVNSRLFPVYGNWIHMRCTKAYIWEMLSHSLSGRNDIKVNDYSTLSAVLGYLISKEKPIEINLKRIFDIVLPSYKLFADNIQVFPYKNMKNKEIDISQPKITLRDLFAARVSRYALEMQSRCASLVSNLECLFGDALLADNYGILLDSKIAWLLMVVQRLRDVINARIPRQDDQFTAMRNAQNNHNAVLRVIVSGTGMYDDTMSDLLLNNEKLRRSATKPTLPSKLTAEGDLDDMEIGGEQDQKDESKQDIGEDADINLRDAVFKYLNHQCHEMRKLKTGRKADFSLPKCRKSCDFSNFDVTECSPAMIDMCAQLFSRIYIRDFIQAHRFFRILRGHDEKRKNTAKKSKKQKKQKENQEPEAKNNEASNDDNKDNTAAEQKIEAEQQNEPKSKPKPKPQKFKLKSLIDTDDKEVMGAFKFTCDERTEKFFTRRLTFVDFLREIGLLYDTKFTMLSVRALCGFSVLYYTNKLFQNEATLSMLSDVITRPRVLLRHMHEIVVGQCKKGTLSTVKRNKDKGSALADLTRRKQRYNIWRKFLDIDSSHWNALKTDTKRMSNAGQLLISFVGDHRSGKSTLVGRLLNDLNCITKGNYIKVQKATYQADNEFAKIINNSHTHHACSTSVIHSYNKNTNCDTLLQLINTPSNEYFVNVMKGLSVSDVCIICVNATDTVKQLSTGYVQQFITACWALNITRIICCITMMDAVKYDQKQFELCKNVISNQMVLRGIDTRQMMFIPVCALNGDNVVNKSNSSELNMWYKGFEVVKAKEEMLNGCTLMDGLNLLPQLYESKLQKRLRERDDVLKMVVVNKWKSRIISTVLDVRVLSGTVKENDEITVMPCNVRAKVNSVWKNNLDVKKAYATDFVSIRLIGKSLNKIIIGDIAYLASNPNKLDPQKKANGIVALVYVPPTACVSRIRKDFACLFMLHSEKVVCTVHKINWKVDMTNPSVKKQGQDLYIERNDKAEVVLSLQKSIIASMYAHNNETGRFVGIHNKNVAFIGKVLDFSVIAKPKPKRPVKKGNIPNRNKRKVDPNKNRGGTQVKLRNTGKPTGSKPVKYNKALSRFPVRKTKTRTRRKK